MFVIHYCLIRKFQLAFSTLDLVSFSYFSIGFLLWLDVEQFGCLFHGYYFLQAQARVCFDVSNV